MTSKARVRLVIHGAAAAAAGVGAGNSQVPGSDAVPLVAIQTAMISDLARHYDVNLTEAHAAALVAQFAAVKCGRFASQVLLGWIPGAGNAVNAFTAAAVTEAIGWSAVSYSRKRAA